jgi:transcriptional regulator with XRE-family HTH domain
MDQQTLAKKIHNIRVHKKLTLVKIAESTGFTKSYLSLIESGKKSPPIATLSKIAQALGVDIAAFFEEKSLKDRMTLVRKDEREVVVRDGTSFGYQYETIASAKRQKRMEPFVVTHPLVIEEMGWFDHEGEELLYVLEGKLKFFYGEEEFLLTAGDSVYFDPSVPHRGETVGRKRAKTLVVISQPAYSSI